MNKYTSEFIEQLLEKARDFIEKNEFFAVKSMEQHLAPLQQLLKYAAYAKLSVLLCEVYFDKDNDYKKVVELSEKTLFFVQKKMGTCKEILQLQIYIMFYKGRLSRNETAIRGLKAIAKSAKKINANAIEQQAYAYLADNYMLVTDYKNSLKFSEKALIIINDNDNIKDKEAKLAKMYCNEAIVYFELGDLEKALFLNQKAYTIGKKFFPNDGYSFLRIYYNRSRIFAEVGRYKEAAIYMQRCVDISRKLDQSDDTYKMYVGIYLNHLIQIQLMDDSLFSKEEVFPLIEEVDRIKEIVKDKQRRRYSLMLKKLVKIHYIVGNNKKAMAYIDESIDIFKQVFSYKLAKNNRDISELYYLKAKIFFESNDIKNAKENIDEALNTIIVDYDAKLPLSTYSDTSLVATNTLQDIILLKTKITLKEGKLSISEKENCLSELRYIISILYKNINNTFAEKAKNRHISENQALFEITLSIAYDLYIETNNIEYAKIAFEVCDQSKGLFLLEHLKGIDKKINIGIPQVLIEQQIELKKKINTQKSHINSLLFFKENKEQKEKAIEDLKANQKAYDDFLIELQQNYPNYSALNDTKQKLTLEALQKDISSSTTLIEYFVGENALFIISISKISIDLQKVEIQKEALKRMIQEFNAAMKDTEENEFEDFYKANKKIFYTLINPIFDNISKQKKLIIIPDYYLFNLPFQAIINYAATEESTNKKYSYLIEDYAFVYNYSAKLLIHLYQKDSTNDGVNLLGIAPVEFKKGDKRTALFTDGCIVQQNDNLIEILNNKGVKNKKSLTTISSLTHSKTEVEYVANLCQKKGYDYTLLSKEAATKSNLLKYIKEDKNTLLIASHGLNTQNEELGNEPSIILYQGDTKTDLNEKLLSCSEVYNLDLKNYSLVVLSCCHTGEGRFLQAGEGNYSLNRGFIGAGAKAVIYTLSAVPDNESAVLVKQFFEQFINKNIDKATALQMAMKKQIKNSNLAPYYWANYCYLGF